MKIQRLLSIVLLSCLLMSQSVFASKRGLLIEIGQYPKGRRSLNTERDAYWMKSVLQQQAFSSVRLLQDKAATASNIRQALGDLIKQCKTNDKVLIHYGGHGTQLDDQPGGDETLDHKDEAFVPYDAPPQTEQNDNRFIRDDEFGKYIDSLRKAVGPQGHVLILIDACHSGTMSRGQAVARTDNIQSTTLTPGNTEEKVQSGWLDLPASSLRSNTAASGGKVVMISGAEPGKSLIEVLDDDKQPVGPLAFSFSKAMLSVSEQATYESLFNQIKKMMILKDPMQGPLIEGDKAAKLLGGDLVLPSLLSWVKLEVGQLHQRFRIPKGMFLGYTRGSEVTVNTKAGRGDNAGISGQVVESTPFESVIELAKPLPKADSVRLQTVLVNQAFQPGSARVTVTGFTKISLKSEIEAALKEVPNVQLVAGEADWLIRPVGDEIELCRAEDGFQLERFPTSDVSNIPARVTAYAQAGWLRDLDIHNSSMRASVEMIPVTLDSETDSIETKLPVVLLKGTPVLRTDQQAMFIIRNTGSVPFYFSVIDILPNADIEVGLPNNKYPAASLRLKPGEAKFIPIRIAPPLGLETYKLLYSKNPIALNTTIQTRGAQTDVGTQQNPLSKLLSARLRGGKEQSLKLDEAGTGEFQFWVQGAK